MTKTNKYFNGKIFGSIGHLPGSKTGEKDHTINDGEAEYFTKKRARKNDKIIVTEKMDGACVGIHRPNEEELVPLIRHGYLATESHRNFLLDFAEWVFTDGEYNDLEKIIEPGEWLVGEWCQRPHGTKYNFHNTSLVADRKYFYPFALLKGDRYSTATEYEYDYLKERVDGKLHMSYEIAVDGEPVTINEAHIALLTQDIPYRDDPAEGAVWRWERDGKVIKRAKWVRPAYEAGYYWDNDETR